MEVLLPGHSANILGPFLERSPVDWAGCRLEAEIPHAARFSVCGSGRVGGRGFVPGQERCRPRCEGGQVTWVSPWRDKLHLPLHPPFVDRMLPAWMPPFLPRLGSFMVAQAPVQTLFTRCCQITGRVSETAWDENRDFLEPHIKAA